MIAAICQARLRSSRLPGKILMEICGKPLLGHIIERVRAAKTIDEIIVATTASAADEPLRKYLTEQGIKMFVGSENDVLDRYYQAARRFRADTVVRVTADDPFKDPEIIDRAVTLLATSQPPVDYVANCSYDGSILATYPEGLDVEVMTIGCLELMWKEARLPSDREHVTPYLFRHAEKFRIVGFQHSENLSALRWTIDYERDLTFAREIYKRMYPKKPLFLMSDVLGILRAEPHLQNINAGTVRYEGYLRSVREEQKDSEPRL